MLEQFKAQHVSTAGLWVPKSTVNVIHFEPTVSTIQIPNLTLTVPAHHQSGTILNETKGGLHDVKEMDHNHSHGFKSSFLYTTSLPLLVLVRFLNLVQSPTCLTTDLK